MPAGARGESRYLAPGEAIQHVARRHVVVLIMPMLVWLTTLAGVAWISFLLTERDPIPLLDNIGIGVVLVVTLYALFRLVQWWKDRYVITDQRVLLIEGIIAVKVAAVSLGRVTETSFTRSLWGRLLGYGELKLDSAGEQLGLASLDYLPKPVAVYRLVTSLLIEARSERPRSADPRKDDTGPLPPVVL
ncbi:MAG: PH domain-containing protein [Actinomycetota bacterium]